MKKSIYSVAVCAVFALTSCSGSLEDSVSGSLEEAVTQAEEELEKELEKGKSEASIVGTWELTDLDMSMEIPAEQQELFEKGKKEMIDNNSNISFNEDGSYTQNMFRDGLMVTDEGTYVVEGDKIITTTDLGMEIILTISSQTDSELTLTTGQGGLTSTMSYKRA